MGKNARLVNKVGLLYSDRKRFLTSNRNSKPDLFQMENSEKMVILNLGCGPHPIENAINVDSVIVKGVDMFLNFNLTPWEWKDRSINGIYMLHSLEHVKNDQDVLRECHRVLKPGGFLFITVPHASRPSSIGNMGHYRTYSMQTLDSYLSRESYMFDKVMFKTEFDRINYMFFPYNEKHPFIKFKYPRPEVTRGMPKIVYWGVFKPIAWLVQKLINLCPTAFEHLWWPWVGGAAEVIWIGRKI